MPPVGTYEPYRKWNNMVEWGTGIGALQITSSPLGSFKIFARRCVSDLLGNKCGSAKLFSQFLIMNMKVKNISLLIKCTIN
jgi:hypothetical protein